jgi:hypothetical protein
MDDDVYERLVKESIRRYGSTRAISRVLNDELRQSTRGEQEILALIASRKIVKTSAREFEEYRRELSKRFEH